MKRKMMTEAGCTSALEVLEKLNLFFL